LTNCTLLLADDHPVMIKGLAAMLQEEESLEVARMITDFDGILPALHAINPTLLILDMNMNGKNTFSIIPIIKKQFPSLKIIIFTSYDLPAFRKEAVRLGINAFLTKNAGKDQLLGTISKVINGESIIKIPRIFSDKEQVLKDSFLIEDKLSKRELEILKLVAQGNTSQQIGEILFISKQTVHWHRKNILAKLKLKTPGEMIKIAYEYGLV